MPHSAWRRPAVPPTRSGEQRNPHAPGARSLSQPLPALGTRRSRTETARVPPNQHSRTDGAMPHAARLPATDRAPRARGRAGTPRGLPGAHGDTARGPVPSVCKDMGTASVPSHRLAVRAPSPIGLTAEFTLFTRGEPASAAAWQQHSRGVWTPGQETQHPSQTLESSLRGH